MPTSQYQVGTNVPPTTTIHVEGPTRSDTVSTHRKRGPAKRKLKKKTGCADYNLAYMKLWWSRMERDGRKSEERGKLRKEDEEQSKRMKIFLLDGNDLNKKSDKINLPETATTPADLCGTWQEYA